VSHAEIETAHNARAVLPVMVQAPLDDFREVRFFRRGRHHETFQVSDWFGWRRRQIECEVYDDVVLLVAMKPQSEMAKREIKRLTRRKVRPGSVLIKYFRNIASGDLHALFPDVRVVMSTFDRVIIGLSALFGGVPIVMHLASTITVLFLVIGFYLGLVAVINDEHWKTALAALGGVIALGGLVMRQWMKYQRQSLKYQKELTDNVYFRNLNNNSGIFDAIIGAAEDQECKEAFLAYYFLHTAKERPTQDELDGRIEQWLKDAFGVDVDFEVDDALAKLERLGVLIRDGGRLAVPPLAEALAQLDRVWDDFFRFKEATAKAETAA
jgi:hypothetical protein